MPSKPKRLKNPGVNVLPHMDPSYPVRPLIDTATKIRATVVILPMPGLRSFVASTLEDQGILVSASTRKGAQTAAMDAYVAKHSPGPASKSNPRYATPEEESYVKRIIRTRQSERSISADKWLKKGPRAAR